MTVFAIQSVIPVGPAAVRVVFSAAAKAISAAGTDDALNPANYQLSGPTTSRVIQVAAVPENPQAFTLFGSALIGAGDWSLLVVGVVAEDGTALTSPNVAIFNVNSTEPQDLVNGGAVDVTPESTLRQFLSPAFIGEGWDALVYALSRGDQYLQDTARGAWDQMFLSTAEGSFLDRLAGEVGVSRPSDVGMSDVVFRELAIRLSSEKITYKALWEILEVFYGRSAVRATIETEVDAPYDLSDLSQLIIDVDGTEYPITFAAADFADINQAQAIEVAATITRQLRNLGSQAWAVATLNPLTGLYRTVVYSPTLGLSSKIRVVGGLAQFGLRFPQLLTTPLTGATYSVTVLDDGRARLDFTGTTAALASVREGDYILAQDGDLNAANKGTFSIEEVAISWTGSAFLQQVTIVNVSAVTQAGPLTVANGDFQFYRPSYTTPSSNGAMVSGAENNIRLHLPTTTAVVDREPLKAAYLPKETTTNFGGLSVDLGPDGTLTATTTVAHGLSAGDWVTLEDVRPTSYVHPMTTAPIDNAAGATGTTGVSRQSMISPIRAVDSFAARTGAVAAVMSNGDIFIHGGRIALSYFSDYKVMRFSGVSQDAANRPVYSYNYFSTADTGYAAAYSAASAYEGDSGVGVLFACGQTANIPTFTSNVRFFLSATGGSNVGTILTVTNAVHPASRLLLALTILDSSQRQQVILIGGQTASTTNTTAISAFNPATNGLAIFAKGTDTEARSRHAGCSLGAADDPTKPTSAIWCGGGIFSGATFIPTDTTNFLSDLITPTWATPGRMAVARYSHRVVDIGGGRALAIGGFGRVLANETVDRVVDEVEMFDVVSGIWVPAGRLQYGRYNPTVFRLGDKVYVYGGMQTTGSPPNLPTEVYDIPSGRWSLTPLYTGGTSGAYFEYGISAVSNGVCVMFGGESATSGSSLTGTSFTAQTRTSAFIEGSNYASPSHRVNGLHRIATTPSSTSFTVSGLPTGDVLRTTMAPGATPSLSSKKTVETQDRFVGPYVWDEDAGPLLTSTEAQTVGDISQFAQIGVLTLTDATAFPDAPGYLALRAGYADAAYPVPYLSRISDTQLAIDFNYVFPFAYASGTTVTLLAQKAPGIPDTASDLGSFYVTNSNAGRVAAEDAVRSAVVSGPDLNVKVLYPSDVGLGNAGYPKAGSQKLSDAVRVWGGDNLTAEVAAAQEEDDIT